MTDNIMKFVLVGIWMMAAGWAGYWLGTQDQHNADMAKQEAAVGQPKAVEKWIPKAGDEVFGSAALMIETPWSATGAVVRIHQVLPTSERDAGFFAWFFYPDGRLSECAADGGHFCRLPRTKEGATLHVWQAPVNAQCSVNESVVMPWDWARTQKGRPQTQAERLGAGK